jgi:hypothetical protein
MMSIEERAKSELSLRSQVWKGSMKDDKCGSGSSSRDMRRVQHIKGGGLRQQKIQDYLACHLLDAFYL